MLQLCVDAVHSGFTENNLEMRVPGIYWHPAHKNERESRGLRSRGKESNSPRAEALLSGAGSLRRGLESLRAVCLKQRKSLPLITELQQQEHLRLKVGYPTQPQTLTFPTLGAFSPWDFNAAWAAARRAIGTRKGEQET